VVKVAFVREIWVMASLESAGEIWVMASLESAGEIWVMASLESAGGMKALNCVKPVYRKYIVQTKIKPRQKAGMTQRHQLCRAVRN
jgi:hypothetical protein